MSRVNRLSVRFSEGGFLMTGEYDEKTVKSNV
jgi:hypothetical protein